MYISQRGLHRNLSKVIHLQCTTPSDPWCTYILTYCNEFRILQALHADAIGVPPMHPVAKHNKEHVSSVKKDNSTTTLEANR